MGHCHWSSAAADRLPLRHSRHLLQRDCSRFACRWCHRRFFVWRRERQTSFVRPHSPHVHSIESSYEHADRSNLRPKDVWTPEPKHLVPFGPYGAGQWTAHPIGLVIVIGLVLMGLVSRTPVSDLIFFSLLGGAVVGMLLWLYHR